MPPTLKTIVELSRFNETKTLFRETATRHLYPILPYPAKMEDHIALLLPHDKDYPLEEYRQPPRSGDPSRIILKQGGVWEIMGE